MKRCHKPCSSIPLIRYNSLNPLDFAPLATLRNFLTSEKGDFVKFLQSKQRNVRLSAKYFAKSSFFDVTKVRNAELPMIWSQTIKLIFADKWNKAWGTCLLTQVVLISSTKPISSSISLSPSIRMEALFQHA